MKAGIKSLLLVSILLWSHSLGAQPQLQEKIDSLLKELPRQKEDTNKVNVLNGLIETYLNVDLDKGVKYGQDALELATKLGWKKGIGLAYNYLGFYYERKQVNGKDLDCFEKALKMYEDIGNKLYQSGVLGSIANVYARRGAFVDAEKTVIKSLALAEEVGDLHRMTNALSTLGRIATYQSDLEKALKYQKRALEVAKEMGNKDLEQVAIVGIGVTYEHRSEYLKALECYQQSLIICEQLGNKIGAAGSMCNIGNIYLVQREKEKGLEYYQKALQIAEEIGHKEYIGNISLNMATVYGEELHDYGSAVKYYEKSLKVYEEIGNKMGVAGALASIGRMYVEHKEFVVAADYTLESIKRHEALGARRDAAIGMIMMGRLCLGIVDDTGTGNKKIEAIAAPTLSAPIAHAVIPKGKTALVNAAISYAQKSLAILKDISDPATFMSSYGILARAYQIKGEYRKAMVASGHFHAIRDSVYSQKNREEILKLSMKNEYDRQRLTDSMNVAEKQKIATINLRKQKSYTYMGVAGIILLAGFSFFIVKERGKSETARKQSEELLLNILPEEVADELKSTGATTAKHYDNITVMFTDFVNFTQAGEQMSPQGLIDELHTCFKQFDEICDKYNIEKIKTIGDAYLAVAGLPTPDAKHAEHIVAAAKEITDFMGDRLAKLGVERTFQIRVGIHSGSVVAGIVGVKKFAYDIWGDTVNTAARMEQNSEAGRVNISADTYELVKDKFVCEYRGEVEAKGKGMMKMYYVS